MSRNDPPAPTPSKLAGILAGASVLMRAPLLKLLGREPDCWRRTLGLGLRSEGTRFALSSFGLQIPTDITTANQSEDIVARFIQQFGRFIVGEPDVHFILKHHPYYVERTPVAQVDLVRCDYRPDGDLLAIKPHLDARMPMQLDAAAQQEVEKIILLAHRSTRQLSDIVRFRQLEQEVRRQIISHTGLGEKEKCLAYAGRILSAVTISSEPLSAEPCARLLPPNFRQHRGLGAGSFDVVLRPVRDDGVDVWLNIHHTACDGASMQEILGRLEAAWGIGEAPRFPAYDAGRPWFIQNCQTSPQDRPICVLVDFLDFAPLSKYRAALNIKLAGQLNSPVPLAAMVLWSLAQEPEFAGRKFATAVDVPADKRWPRGVDLVSIRPEDYFARPDGFIAFIRDFLGIVNAGQARRSRTYAAMRALSLVAPRFAAQALASNPGRARATFGTVGLSILKNAKVFVAPMADAGWDDGFLALGNLSLSASDGRAIGVLTVKGDPARIAECAKAFRSALSKADSLFSKID